MDFYIYVHNAMSYIALSSIAHFSSLIFPMLLVEAMQGSRRFIVRVHRLCTLKWSCMQETCTNINNYCLCSCMAMQVVKALKNTLIQIITCLSPNTAML